MIKSKIKWLYALIIGAFMLVVTVPVSGCGFYVNCIPSIAAEITIFEPADGTFYPGDDVTSTLRFKNTGSESSTFWIGYSVKSQAGEWYDVAAHPLMLNSNELSPPQHMTWTVPEMSYTTGYYTVALAVWDAEPGTAEANQLAYREEANSFQVLTYIEQFESFNKDIWEKSSHNLGYSYLDPDNVDIKDSIIRIKVPARTKNGGEFGTKASFMYGTYRARIRVPSIAGLVTGFFLYHGTGGSGDEIDIELYHDNKWYVAFTTWSNGIITGTERKRLQFDPCDEYHEYKIDFYPEELTFFVDGGQMQIFDSGLPDEQMRLLVNSWFPEWLYSAPPKNDVYTLIDWIQY